jgi:hypothetical protein
MRTVVHGHGTDWQQPKHEAMDGAARGSGTPFISHNAPDEILAMARDADFACVRHVTAGDYTRRYVADRTDDLAIHGRRTASGNDLTLLASRLGAIVRLEQLDH